MEEQLRQLLLTSSAIYAHVGSRVDWGLRPQGAALPALTLMVVSGADQATLQGTDHLSDARVQVDCWGSTYGAAKILSRAVIARLNGHKDTNFAGIFHAGTRDLNNDAVTDPVGIFGVSLDFTLHHRSN